MNDRLMRAAVIVLAFAAARNCAAQQAMADVRVADFVSRARLATERFKDIEVAISESYVKVGPDFPAMGEHWVNGELIMKAELDAARPAILTYATIGGTRQLTGVVYAIALKKGENPPSLPQGAQWHDHVGTVDEESLLFGHDEHHTADDVRLVVMHAWIWLENPDGMFATDNWALPLARVGLDAREHVSPSAARALAFLSGASPYYARLLASVAELDDRESDAVASILESHRGHVSRWWDEREATRALTPLETAWLSQTWRQLGEDVQRSVRKRAASRLSRLW